MKNWEIITTILIVAISSFFIGLELGYVYSDMSGMSHKVESDDPEFRSVCLSISNKVDHIFILLDEANKNKYYLLGNTDRLFIIKKDE